MRKEKKNRKHKKNAWKKIKWNAGGADNIIGGAGINKKEMGLQSARRRVGPSWSDHQTAQILSQNGAARAKESKSDKQEDEGAR